MRQVKFPAIGYAIRLLVTLTQIAPREVVNTAKARYTMGF